MTTEAQVIKTQMPNPPPSVPALLASVNAALEELKAKDAVQMNHVIFNAYTNATLTVLFLCVVLSVLFYALKVGRAAWVKPERSDKETPFQPIPDA